MTDFKEIKSKIDSGEFTVVKRHSKSEVYDIFYDIKDTNGVLIKHAMQCSRCKNIYTSTFRGTTYHLRHHCFLKYKAKKDQQIVKQQPTNDWKNKCTELVVQWILRNCRPCNIVNDDEFHKLAEFLIQSGHTFGSNIDCNNLMPNSSTVTTSIASLYEEQHETLKEELDLVKNIGFSITCDMWRDSNLTTSHVGATVHYIKGGSVAHKMLGIREVANNQNSGSLVRNTIVDILKEFDCELNQMVTIVTDRSSYMREAFQNDRSIICINHLLNNVVEAAVSDTTEVKTIATTCSELVNYIKRSELNRLPNIIHESNTATRWNSVFYLLHSVQENWDDINQTLQDKNFTSKLADLKLADITEILEVLNHFEKATRILGNEHYPTLHQVYPQIRKLKIITSKNHPNESQIIKKFKDKLLFYMETLLEPNIQDLHKIALFLFPPANKLQNFTENEKRSIHDKCKEMLIDYESSRYKYDISFEFLDVDADTEEDAFGEFVQPTVSLNFQNEIASEVLRYERQTAAYFKKFDPLEWWEMHKREFPLLCKLCSYVLAIPASSAPSERLFSKAPQLLSESVVEIKPIGVKQIMFLNANLDLNGDSPNQDYVVENNSYDSESDSECSNAK